MPSSVMWCPSLLHASLLLCLARETLQGGVKPQSMSWRRIMPARGVGIGTKGVNGAHGSVGRRYVNKPLKAGVGHYAVPSPLGVMGYQPLGQGFVPGRFPAYGNPGLYGGNLGTGLPLGHAPANGHGLGHGAKRVYGVNPVTGFAPYAGMGYPAVRPGVSAAELGPLEEAARSQAAQDQKSAKTRALGGPEEYGRSAMWTGSRKSLGSEVMSTGSGLKILDPKPKMSRPTTGDSSLGQAVGGAPEPSVLSHGARQPQSVGNGGAGNYLGGNVAPGSYGPALGQGGYLGAAGKLGAALGQGGYTKGVSTGYANGAGPYGGALAGNGLGYGNGYANPYGAALATGSYAGQPQVPYGGLSAGLDPGAGKYGENTRLVMIIQMHIIMKIQPREFVFIL
ncbi:fibroin heavy chain isoform X2 [Hippocampus zosterae]|uniref:fibroin heavy chain isoform X2 n=1 Tax=Hippocampus zosterae TaxID=109293 RepID=UPI00223E0A73|nr:fibroin heavy chain isoform X2 [Hippocampus zosterae]